MTTKADKLIVKQQFWHLVISFLTFALCIVYIKLNSEWNVIGKLWSLLIPIVFAGELIKVQISRFYERRELQSIVTSTTATTTPKNRPKSSAFNITEIPVGLAFQVISTVLFALICMILGAPVLNNYEKTFVLSALLTLLTVSPTIFLLGPGGALKVCFCEKTEISSKSIDASIEIMKYNALGALLGAWAGSVAAPLDWDREWQQYPIPNVVGMLLGSALGNLYVCGKIWLQYIKNVFGKKYY